MAIFNCIKYLLQLERLLLQQEDFLQLKKVLKKNNIINMYMDIFLYHKIKYIL